MVLEDSYHEKSLMYLSCPSVFFHRPRRMGWWAIVGVVAFWFNFVGVNLLQSGLTRWCLMESILRKLGIQPGC